MRKYNKQIFCRFLRLIGVIVTLVLK